jgi:hypothetical protein
MAVTFVRSIPANGARNVSLTPVIQTFFDKNVVNDSVWENNREEFDLVRNEIIIPINVTRIPDTVDFDRRREIFIQPVNSLRPNTSYGLVIKKNLTSKSGETLGKQIRISFTTRGITPEE